MSWEVEYTDEFEEWWDTLSEDKQDAVAAHVQLIELMGPNLRFPYSSDIRGSKHGHLRELRIQYKGQPLVLGYANWAKIGEPKSLQVSVSGFHKGGKSYCEWVYPGAFTKK